MSKIEVLQALEQIDLLDDANSDILCQLQLMLRKVEEAKQARIASQVEFLESIAIDFPEGVDFNEEDLL